MTDTCSLVQDEYRVCKVIGKQRHIENKRAGTINKKVLADYTNDLALFEANTLAAEMLVAKDLNVYPDFSFHPRKGGADLQSAGYKIDVKWSIREVYNLCTSVLKDDKSADIYILVLGEYPHMVIAGWCWSSEFINPVNLRRGKAGATDYYLLPKTRLRPMSGLVPVLRKGKIIEHV